MPLCQEKPLVDWPPHVEPLSEPDYPHRHSGTALVCGTAWTLKDDLAKAIRLRPNATIVGVNRTGQFVKCDMLVSIDRKKAAGWRTLHEHRFGPLRYGYHGTKPTADSRTGDFPAVDYWWRNFDGGGTSSWVAAKVALATGHDEVILCGVPMEPGPYVDGEQAESFSHENHLRNCRDVISTRDAWMHPFVRSVSGWTAAMLGMPD